MDQPVKYNYIKSVTKSLCNMKQEFIFHSNDEWRIEMYEKDDSSQKRFINFCWRYKSFFFFYNKGWNFHCSDTHLIRNHGLKTCPFKTHKRTYTHTLSLFLSQTHTLTLTYKHTNIQQQHTYKLSYSHTHSYEQTHQNTHFYLKTDMYILICTII